MITRCNHCESKFEVSSDLVFSDDPQVRCGECMSLFDARENLYNESISGRAAVTYSPVQKSRIADSIDPMTIETADTVAVEHFYQSAGARASSVSSDTSAASEFAQDSGLGSTSDGADHQLDVDLSRSPDRYPSYRADQESAAKLEFERTLASDSLLRDLPGDMSSPDSTSGGPTDVEASQILSDAEITERNRQRVRERELRALEMDNPSRKSTVDENVATENRTFEKSGLDNPRHENGAVRSPANKPKPVRQSDGLRQRDRKDYAFIPENVLRKPDTNRDGGRRGQPRFKPGSPQFDQWLNNREEEQQRVGDSIHQTRAPSQSRGARRSDTERYARRPVRENIRNPRSDERLSDEYKTVSGSSAQEMRRYQHYRPGVEVNDVEPIEERVVVKKRRGSIFGSMLWIGALIFAICLLVFSARNVIAKMNLPEPFIGAFCQVTGCVPVEPKKDSSLLEAKHKRLYSHPEIDNALVISVDVVNNSVYKQPYPELVVTLLDAQSEAVAQRSFVSSDYTVVDGSEPGFLMPSEPTRVKIEVIDTELGATGIELEFK